MTYALVLDGSIIQTAPAKFAVPDTLTWVDISTVTPQPAENWTAKEVGGVWGFSAPVIAAPSLTQQASDALSTARIYVSNNYTMLNKSTPDEWVTYLTALMAIVGGTDTTSTALPTAPTS